VLGRKTQEGWKKSYFFKNFLKSWNLFKMQDPSQSHGNFWQTEISVLDLKFLFEETI
jgi:hypothetical protein